MIFVFDNRVIEPSVTEINNIDSKQMLIGLLVHKWLTCLLIIITKPCFFGDLCGWCFLCTNNWPAFVFSGKFWTLNIRGFYPMSRVIMILKLLFWVVVSFITGQVRKRTSCLEEFALEVWYWSVASLGIGKSRGSHESFVLCMSITIHSAMIRSHTHTDRQNHLQIKLSQRVTALAAIPDDMNLITKTLWVEGENQLSWVHTS